ncbi:hypothetical protein VOLCADRAFT_60905 [Volvox carteri f. nagariensis]|uniref:monoamine oxidase n=1 Tax=Volvox carteri f. nagariensis TaxID=3068 RepID=D8TWQ4_VOLCA|nr:uncharacterized protein VOLCADRAFT_60905 [Volvox carteri f. nagariensis]EFJ48092.1 hypothetical protein VOLCADRAFT_60905 [Volvox carteri f. nagariensis]|eukprot:XP_002950777.1 hypothetical protein VOLCADRAFT_60905 [Volvox carteri f. nagariensis]
MQACDVCIIGAGLSGLACAKKLHEIHRESTILILEARDRVGGRTLSVPFHGDAVDLGGQWVGPAQHRALTLLHELGLKTVRQTWFGESQSSSGPNLTDLVGLGYRSLDAWAAGVRDPGSWSRADAVAWDRLSVQDFFDAHVALPGVRRELDLLVRTVTASEPAHLSFLYFLAFLGMCGGLTAVGDGDGGAQSFKVAGGAQQLACRLACDLQARGGVEVRLNTAVTHIAWQSDRDTISACTTRIQASKVVLAISPPLWGTIEWSPPLPLDKAAVASRMYMGSAVKTIAVYKTRFWDSGRGGVAAAPAAAVRQLYLEDLGPVANLFPSTVAGAPALIGLITAASAATFASLREHERRAQVLRQYEHYFGTAAARTECTDFISKDWIREPYSRGCFAALMPPGLATCSGGAAARRPLGGSRNVFFAGTELASEWAGYIEGAIEAGYRAAEEVATALGGGGTSPELLTGLVQALCPRPSSML